MAKEKLKDVLSGITLQNESVGELKGNVVEKDFDGKKRIAWVVTFTLNGEKVQKVHNTGLTKEEYQEAMYCKKKGENHYPLQDVRFLDYMFTTVERYAIPLWIEQAKERADKTNPNISERITKTENKTVETKIERKTLAPKKKNSPEDTFITKMLEIMDCFLEEKLSDNVNIDCKITQRGLSK